MSALPARVQALLNQADRALAAGDAATVARSLLAARVLAPDAWPVLRAEAAFNRRIGRAEAAARTLARAASLYPNLVAQCVARAALAADADDTARCETLLTEAAQRAVDFDDWLVLGLELDALGHNEKLLDAATKALELKPDSQTARLLRARAAQALGQVALAASDYRTLLARRAHVAKCWFALLDLKTLTLSAQELLALEAAARDQRHSREDQALLKFALGRAYEAAADAPRAFAMLAQANALVATTWDPQQFASEVSAVKAAFSQPGCSAPAQGREVIFLVGLPRSGTTLIEQILASHSLVEGASELPYLAEIISAESARRKQPLAAWAPLASSDDWQRLGAQYLKKSARWRTQKPIATDKLPENWLLAAAALKMLPDARVIDCRRDAVETCWSCFKQLFAPGRVGFTYSLAHLAHYYRHYASACATWATQFPTRFRIQHYEAILSEPEKAIRELLAFCDLPYDAACLSPNLTQRSVRSASAAQVREPIKSSTARSGLYGELLAPLRAQLASDHGAG